LPSLLLSFKDREAQKGGLVLKAIWASAVILTASVSHASADCRTLIQNALDNGYLRVESISASGSRVVVSQAFWNAADYAARRGIFYNLNCAIAGNGNQLTKILLISSRTGKILATQDWGKIEINE
jgi:hypothetical protein